MHSILNERRLISKSKRNGSSINSPRSDKTDTKPFSLRILPRLKP